MIHGGGLPPSGTAWSAGPPKSRAYVNGNSSPGADTKSASPMRYQTTSVLNWFACAGGSTAPAALRVRSRPSR